MPLAAICGGALTFAFSVQKQQIEELRLFRDLFDRFNERYDVLNEKLNRIRERPGDAPLELPESDTLFKYFNLCGEEHLYFQQGFIYPEVWQSWESGMKFFPEPANQKAVGQRIEDVLLLRTKLPTKGRLLRKNGLITCCSCPH